MPGWVSASLAVPVLGRYLLPGGAGRALPTPVPGRFSLSAGHTYFPKLPHLVLPVADSVQLVTLIRHANTPAPGSLTAQPVHSGRIWAIMPGLFPKVQLSASYHRGCAPGKLVRNKFPPGWASLVGHMPRLASSRIRLLHILRRGSVAS